MSLALGENWLRGVSCKQALPEDSVFQGIFHTVPVMGASHGSPGYQGSQLPGGGSVPCMRRTWACWRHSNGGISNSYRGIQSNPIREQLIRDLKFSTAHGGKKVFCFRGMKQISARSRRQHLRMRCVACWRLRPWMAKVN